MGSGSPAHFKNAAVIIMIISSAINCSSSSKVVFDTKITLPRPFIRNYIACQQPKRCIDLQDFFAVLMQQFPAAEVQLAYLHLEQLIRQ